MELKQHQGWWMPSADVTMPGDMSAAQYQQRQRDGFLNHIQQHTGYLGAAVDVGAHIGLWSRRLTECFRRVYAYEPIPELAECYRRNITNDNYNLREIALSDTTGTLHIDYDPVRSQNTHIDVTGTAVITETLDAQAIPHTGLIKIDVEGWEIPVLLGGQITIARDHPWIIVEEKQGAQARVGRHKQEIRMLLESWGYRRVSKIANDVLYGY